MNIQRHIEYLNPYSLINPMLRRVLSEFWTIEIFTTFKSILNCNQPYGHHKLMEIVLDSHVKIIGWFQPLIFRGSEINPIKEVGNWDRITEKDRPGTHNLKIFVIERCWQPKDDAVGLVTAFHYSVVQIFMDHALSNALKESLIWIQVNKPIKRILNGVFVFC